MNAGKGYNSNPKSTKRLKLNRVAPVDNRAPNDKTGAPKKWWVVAARTLKGLLIVVC